MFCASYKTCPYWKADKDCKEPQSEFRFWQQASTRSKVIGYGAGPSLSEGWDILEGLLPSPIRKRKVEPKVVNGPTNFLNHLPLTLTTKRKKRVRLNSIKNAKLKVKEMKQREKRAYSGSRWSKIRQSECRTPQAGRMLCKASPLTLLLSLWFLKNKSNWL